MAEGTNVKVEGTFTYEINQGGLDYDKPKERKEAVEDFKECLERFLDSIERLDDNFISLSYDLKDIKVEVGE